MTSKQYGLPSATPEVLIGDVYLLDDGGTWRVVLTASGIPVDDRWKVPRDWRDNLGAKQYSFRTPRDYQDDLLKADFIHVDDLRFIHVKDL